MRVVAELGTGRIVQVMTGDADAVKVNGRFLVDAPSGLKLDIGASTTVDAPLLTAMHDQLVANLPAFPHWKSNALTAAADVAKLDLASTATILGVVMKPRLQTGRVADGIAPNMTALLEANTATSPMRPGMIQTATIDVSADVPAGGVDTFLVYWSVWQAATTQDVRTTFPTDVNTPAIKTLTKVDQNISTLRAYLTNDDGAHWTRVRWMEPTRMFDKGTAVRICFANDDPSAKLYLLGYAVLYGAE